MTAFALVEMHDPLRGVVYEGAYASPEMPYAPDPSGAEWLHSSLPRLDGDIRRTVEIIAGFLATNTVSQHDVAYLHPEPGDYWDSEGEYEVFVGALENSGMSAGRLQPTETTFLSIDWAEYPVLTDEGLVAEVNQEDGTARPFLDHNVRSAYSGEVAALAEELGATVVAFQCELVWREGKPRLLSGREHAQLGTLDEHGRFEPILTLLDGDYFIQPPTASEPAIPSQPEDGSTEEQKDHTTVS